MPLFPCSMLKKETQRTLALYFSAMILLNGFLVWRSAHGIAVGLSDFASFYTAAEILHDGRGRQLYDLNLQEEVQRSVVPAAVKERGAILPFNHPAFEAVMFMPLAAFSYRTAYLIWFSVNVGLLAAVILIIRKNLLFLGQLPLYLWAAAALAFTPLIVTLIQGQDSIVLLFCYCMVFTALRSTAEFLAGSWLALGLFKFQLSLPLIVPFLLLKRRRIIAGYCFVGILLMLIALRTVGFSAVLDYPRYVWGLDHNAQFRSLVSSPGMPNLHGLISRLVPRSRPGMSAWLLLITSAILLAVSTFCWHTVYRGDSRHLEVPFAVNLISSVLVGYHTWSHDLSVLFLALLLVLEKASSDSLLSESSSKTLSLVCIALLWSPLDIILIHFRSLELLAIIFVVLLGTLVIQNRRTVLGAGIAPQAGNTYGEMA
jgi:Glycosyltransferase family 87